MSDSDQLRGAIEAIYAAGLDAQHWPQALAGVTQVIGGIAATLEVFERKPRTLIEFRSFGLPPANELAYLDHYSTLNPRIPALIDGRYGAVVTDYSVISEQAMRHDAFYADFLAPAGFRYFIGGILMVGDRQSSLFSVQRATRQGHVDEREVALIRRLAPHLQRAHDTARRLQGAERRQDALERTLDWLTDGAALLHKNGHVLHANEAFRAIAARGDGLRIVGGAMEFAAPDARASFAAAFAAIGRLRDGEPVHAPADFPVRRTTGAPAYVVSLRPLIGKQTRDQRHDPVAILFVRDPLGRSAAAARMLRELFGLTAAEASLALAIQSGISLPEYASQSGLSLNTVYTHLRRIKDKTGCHRMAGLNRMLRELQVPLR